MSSDHRASVPDELIDPRLFSTAMNHTNTMNTMPVNPEVPRPANGLAENLINTAAWIPSTGFQGSRVNACPTYYYPNQAPPSNFQDHRNTVHPLTQYANPATQAYGNCVPLGAPTPPHSSSKYVLLNSSVLALSSYLDDMIYFQGHLLEDHAR